MRGFIYCRCLTWIVCLLLCTQALSAGAQGKKWALLIGIEEYDRAEISRLDFAVKDVNAIARALQLNLGYEPAHIRIMSSAIKDPNDSNRPTNDNVIATLERLAKSIGPEDTFLFYFTGHGFNKDSQNFLASVNANPLSVNTLKRSAIPMADLQQTMQAFKAKQILFVIDACRNDPEKGKGEGDNKLTGDFSKSLVLASRSGQTAGSGVLFACSEGERAFEDPSKGQSIFTYYLLEALSGKAGNKGPLAMADVMRYVRKEVGAWAEEHGKKQTPELLPKEADRLVLADRIITTPVADVAASIKLLDTEAALTIASDPPGADVIVDGKTVGTTPFTLTYDLGLDEKKTVRIGLSLEGYKSQPFSVELVRGRALTAQPIKLNAARPKMPKEPAQPVKAVKRTLPDGAELVFIPAGEFTMGSTEADITALLASDARLKREWFTQEIGQHKVYLDGYYIAKTPVTVRQYLAFCAATGHAKPPAPDFNANWSKEEHPIVNVSWDDAAAYCAWISKESGLKVSLPTEAQWEKAARGADGLKFPWGNTWDGSKCANSVGMRLTGTMPVGSFASGASPYGVLDMAGNVFQWCADYYGETYYASSPKNNPQGPGSGQYRALRGGSWGFGSGTDFRCAVRGRDAPGDRFLDLGFRCVVSAE